MIVESSSIVPTAHPKLHPNLVFFLTFALITIVTTPFLLNFINRNNHLALLSPLPEPGAIFPTLAPTNPATIAAPAGENQEAPNTSTEKSNSTKNSFILPAGQNEFQVYNPKISSSSYIYLIPTTKTNSVVSVKNKSAGVFTVQVSPAENIDLTVDYLLINQ